MTRRITKEQRLRKRHVRQRNERRISLMHKAYKYGTICHADIFLGIRLKENGHVFTFQSDRLGFWSPMTTHLKSYFPVPFCMTSDDFEKPTELVQTKPNHLEMELSRHSLFSPVE
ncbi:hypothetical protein TSTA_102120 [Talaromyces stipitatus ATCC 10500]|uniref:MADS-box domain-containing protein n=1 Tax=Talaromyces stipitatus (strain ATCC 10500 / CBS 375.48 / QM 6759 / NRRL 1006) TaxID=441959 RepID=B8MN33_TALSN|nr:uncharacterized protein TSTA_102120 [Talaromyces stipitatus ATCC 10500]EED13982.1 hypothetical protein TSTA_102120 [Talaromyces stipitatus ATCC 10500]